MPGAAWARVSADRRRIGNSFRHRRRAAPRGLVAWSSCSYLQIQYAIHACGNISQLHAITARHFSRGPAGVVYLRELFTHSLPIDATFANLNLKARAQALILLQLAAEFL